MVNTLRNCCCGGIGLGAYHLLSTFVGYYEGKLWVVLALCRWLWIAVDQCGLFVTGCLSVLVIMGHYRSLWVIKEP